MRSAQSRLGIVTSLGSARRGAVRCVESLPVSLSTLRLGGSALAGVAGVALLRGLVSLREKAKKKAADKAAPAAAARNSVAGYLLSETVLTLLLPLCRRYFLGEGAPAGTALPPLGRFLKSGR